MIAFQNHYIGIIFCFCFSNYEYLASNYLLKENALFEKSSTNFEIASVKECPFH